VGAGLRADVVSFTIGLEGSPPSSAYEVVGERDNVFDFGLPEFLVIAIATALVLGPRRLAQVMRRVGQVYRRARALLRGFTGEARRTFAESMQEAEEGRPDVAADPSRPAAPRQAPAGVEPPGDGFRAVALSPPGRPRPNDEWLASLDLGANPGANGRAAGDGRAGRSPSPPRVQKGMKGRSPGGRPREGVEVRPA